MELVLVKEIWQTKYHRLHNGKVRGYVRKLRTPSTAATMKMEINFSQRKEQLSVFNVVYAKEQVQLANLLSLNFILMPQIGKKGQTSVCFIEWYANQIIPLYDPFQRCNSKAAVVFADMQMLTKN